MSNETLDAEVISSAVVTRPQMSVTQAMGVDEIVAQVTLIQKVMRSVMREGEHYGTIPGCGDKKTLLQPGAQKLTMTFRLCPEYTIQEVNLERGHKEYRINCSLKSMGSGAFVGQGVGCCSTMESKYRWRGGARKCPHCGKEAIIKGKAEYGGGWLCFAKKGGCGAKWDDGAKEIEGQSVEKVENDNPADSYNTVLKIAKKRAFVDATITATAASDIFTQDIGDDENEPGGHEPPPPPKPKTAAQPAPQAKPATQPKPAAVPSDISRNKMITSLNAAVGDASRKLVTEFFQKVGGLLPDFEDLEDLPLRFVPATTGQMRELSMAISAFEAGEPAKLPYAPNQEPLPASKPASKPAASPATPSKTPSDDEAWRDIIVPIPRKGQKRADYLKNPDTIGSLFEMRHGSDDESAAARQRLWGFVSNYQPKPWTGNDGQERPPSASDVQFREYLDMFADWFERNHPGEKL